MAGLNRLFLFAAVSVGLLDVLQNLQNDLNGAVGRGHFNDDDRSKLLDINGTLAVNLGRQRNKKPVDEKEMKSTVKEIEKSVGKGDFAREDAAKLNLDVEELKHWLGHH